MYRRRVDRGGIALLLALLLGWPAAAWSQNVSSPQLTGVEMTMPVRQALKQVEDQWLQWIGAFHQKDPQKVDSVTADLLATAQQVGMARLPDLAVGAATAAVQAAREDKDFTRARWALAAAERLDPGRPEIAFAGAAVSRLEGSYPGAVVELAQGYLRLFRQPLERDLWLQNLAVWSLTLLLVTGGLFIAVQMLAKGTSLFQDVADLFGRWLPRPAAFTLAGLTLLWPLALPYGPLWLALYWSL
ncbi:MAG TPA: hypothetical protein VHN15_02595, partial [Thermoanaerobaculia bacterium]|nr:hypothetical protein [Thermoanaerobaculia bacterium]